MKLHRLSGLVVVALAAALSVASTEAGNGPGGSEQCGPLDPGGAEGAECTQKEDCVEVCCLCQDSDYGFVARGCDLEAGACYGGDTVCELALDADGSLCGSADDAEQ